MKPTRLPSVPMRFCLVRLPQRWLLEIDLESSVVQPKIDAGATSISVLVDAALASRQK